MRKRFRFIVAFTILALAGYTWAQDTEATILQHCDLEWPNDAQMHAYCVNQQRDAVNTLNTLAGSNGGIPADAYRNAYHRCEHEWPNDYNMQAYCIQQQIEGYRGFHSTSLMETSVATETEREQIYRHCTIEWSTDYSMLNYCKTQQLDSLNVLKSRPEWVSAADWDAAIRACMLEWPNDFSMAEYCTKRSLNL